MTITIRNQADVHPKYIRFLRWKIRKIKDKFNNLIYANIHISKEGHGKPIYKAVVRLGVPGHDIIITNESTELFMLWKKSLDTAERHLRKYKDRLNEHRVRGSVMT